MVSLNNLSQQERQRFYNQYGMWPEEASLGRPQIAPEREFPLILPRDVTFDPTDVQALGQKEEDEYRTFIAKITRRKK